jgi:hypothetical protein
MRHARSLRLAAIAGLFLAAGCTHNHYYGNAIPVCEAPVVGTPVVASSAPVAYGSICEVPTRVGGGTVVANAGPAEPVVTNRRPPARVVVSEPHGVGRVARNGLGWRGRNEEASISTRVSGALDEDVIR